MIAGAKLADLFLGWWRSLRLHAESRDISAIMPQDNDGKVRLAKSNSHLFVVLAINLYLPRYNAKQTGNKRIRLELVRWWCSVEVWLAMLSRYLMQNKGLSINGY